MFMNSPFNPLQYAHQLEEVGVPKNQAEVHANTLVMVLDHYAQLNDLKRDVAAAVSAIEVQLRAEIAASEVRVQAKVEASETRLAARIDKLEQTLQERFRWQWWANGVMVAMLLGLYFR